MLHIVTSSKSTPNYEFILIITLSEGDWVNASKSTFVGNEKEECVSCMCLFFVSRRIYRNAPLRIEMNLIGLEQLKENKQASGRMKDINDLQNLTKRSS